MTTPSRLNNQTNAVPAAATPARAASPFCELPSALQLWLAVRFLTDAEANSLACSSQAQLACLHRYPIKRVLNVSEAQRRARAATQSSPIALRPCAPRSMLATHTCRCSICTRTAESDDAQRSLQVAAAPMHIASSSTRVSAALKPSSFGQPSRVAAAIPSEWHLLLKVGLPVTVRSLSISDCQHYDAYDEEECVPMLQLPPCLVQLQELTLLADDTWRRGAADHPELLHLLEYLPPSITQLTLSRLLRGAVPPLVLKNRTLNIRYCDKYGRSVPPSVGGCAVPTAEASVPTTKLELSDDCNHESALHLLPVSLTSLTFSIRFNCSLVGTNWPARLTELDFGGMFQQSLERVIPPPALQRLRVGRDWNLEVEPHINPFLRRCARLSRLEFGNRFNQSINGSTISCNHPQLLHLPSTLTELKLSLLFNHPLCGLPLPSSLRVLLLGARFNHRLDRLSPPAALHYVRVGPSFQQPVEAYPQFNDAVAHRCQLVRLSMLREGLSSQDETGKYEALLPVVSKQRAQLPQHQRTDAVARSQL